MAFPTSIPRSRNRRRLGRNQFPTAPETTFTAAASASTATLTFAAPVVSSGSTGISVAGRTALSQIQTSQTSIAILFSGALAGLAWVAVGPVQGVATFTGGGVAGSSGTF